MDEGQGDPLSPLLFVIAIDSLHKLFDLTTQESLLSPVHHRSTKLRVSLYTNDATVFLKIQSEKK
jgi:hypothetical protein